MHIRTRPVKVKKKVHNFIMETVVKSEIELGLPANDLLGVNLTQMRYGRMGIQA